MASETSRVGSKTNQSKVKEIVKGLVEKEIGKTKSVEEIEEKVAEDSVVAEVGK